MPVRGPVLPSFLYPLKVCVQVWPAESLTVKLSVPFEDSRTKATRRSPGLVAMFTEKEVKAAPLVSMLFWTCTKAGGGGSGFIPIPERLTLCGLPEALSATVRLALRLPVAAGVKVTLMVQLELGPSVDGYMGQL